MKGCVWKWMRRSCTVYIQYSYIYIYTYMCVCVCMFSPFCLVYTPYSPSVGDCEGSCEISQIGCCQQLWCWTKKRKRKRKFAEKWTDPIWYRVMCFLIYYNLFVFYYCDQTSLVLPGIYSFNSVTEFIVCVRKVYRFCYDTEMYIIGGFTWI